MSDNPDAYLRLHRLDVLFRELMEQVSKRRPERPLRPMLAAMQAVEATANKDPSHIQRLVSEAFESEGKLFEKEEERDTFDSFDPMNVRVSPVLSNIIKNERSRRGSVSAESYDPSQGISNAPLSIPKTESERSRLLHVITANTLMKGVPEQTRTQIMEAMFERKVRASEIVIREGDLGDNFYLIESGKFDILKEGQGVINTLGANEHFGEIALMYNQPRLATVMAVEDSVIWGVDGSTFRKVVIDIAYRRRMLYKDLLSRVPLFTTLSQPEVSRIAEALVPVKYSQGETIIKQGDLGQEFFIIATGTAEVFLLHQHVNTLSDGDFFGELALLSNAPRSATVIAKTDMECLVLSRADFNRLMGPLLPYLERNKEHYKKYQPYIEETTTA